MRTVKISVLVLVLLMLALPALQLRLNLFKETPLGGYYTKIEKPSLKIFNLAGWFNGSFQDTLSFRINSHMGLRGPLIRVNNQCDYTFFGMIHADGFVRGKKGMLYEEDYIHEYTGNYFIGKAPIDKKLARLKNVMDSLKAHGVTLILVFEPGKASFYPEYIPDRYFSAKKRSNYGKEDFNASSKVIGRIRGGETVETGFKPVFANQCTPHRMDNGHETVETGLKPVSTNPDAIEPIPTRHASPVTNYAYYLSRCLDLGLPFIDLNRWFLEMKDTARYPLFPKYGMHWSLYAVPLAVDTLVKAIEAATGKDLPGFSTWIPGEGEGIQNSKFKVQNSKNQASGISHWPLGKKQSNSQPCNQSVNQSISQSVNQSINQSISQSKIPLGSDNDIGLLLNLVFAPKRTNEVYPEVAFDTVTPREVDALVIADSYYVNIVDTFGQKLFRKQNYWYYNKKLYPYQNDNPPKYVDKSNLREKLLGYDVILLMVSEINLHCGFWNFADEAYLAFHPEEKDPWIYDIENEIRNERSWFRFMVRKARMQQRPLNELITTDARYTYYSNIANYPPRNREDSIYHIALSIRNSPDWFEVVRKKAVQRNIPIDSMVMIDAEFTWEEQQRIK